MKMGVWVELDGFTFNQSPRFTPPPYEQNNALKKYAAEWMIIPLGQAHVKEFSNIIQEFMQKPPAERIDLLHGLLPADHKHFSPLPRFYRCGFFLNNQLLEYCFE